jgi:hypothetical protein
MTHMAMVYRRPVGVMRQSVKPQLASWDRAGHPSQVKLARFLAHVGAIAGPVLATVSGRVAAELIVGSYERREWKQKLHDRLAVQAATIDPGPVGLKIALTTGPGRNWASLWKPLIDAFGPVLGEDPTLPFHPHDDRIVSLGLHHTIDTGVAHDVIIDAWWTRL